MIIFTFFRLRMKEKFLVTLHKTTAAYSATTSKILPPKKRTALIHTKKETVLRTTSFTILI